MQNSSTPRKWEIWLACVKFEDNPSQIKNRPVLVVSPGQFCILSLKITGSAPRVNCPGEYSIVKWKESGLSKPSTIRTSKRLKLIPSDMVHKIGKLQAYDILALQNVLAK